MIGVRKTALWGGCSTNSIGRCCNTDAVNYNCPPSVPGKVQTVSDDTKCKFVGCTDSTKVDYNPSATAGDQFNCEEPYPPPGGVGCTQVDASQYKLFATNDDVGPCEIFGCTSTFAINYNPRATVPGIICIEARPGCTNSIASNYDESYNVDSGTCSIGGCTDSTKVGAATIPIAQC